MNFMAAIVMIFVAYLCGSIPVGYVMARLWGIDVLKSGSGKIGGTNVLRSAGLVPAALTILGDAFKGLIPTYAAVSLTPVFFSGMLWVAPLAGAAAVLGHNHSIFLKFRGGVGAVTALACLGALSFISGVVAVTVAITAIAITRFASAASFSGSVAGLIMLVVLGITGQAPMAYILFGVIVLTLVSLALRPNFARIKAGTERKIGTQEKQIETV